MTGREWLATATLIDVAHDAIIAQFVRSAIHTIDDCDGVDETNSELTPVLDALIAASFLDLWIATELCVEWVIFWLEEIDLEAGDVQFAIGPIVSLAVDALDDNNGGIADSWEALAYLDDAASRLICPVIASVLVAYGIRQID